jgi:DNA-binding NtrC family response regulator
MKCKILVVDDESGIRNSFRDILDREGYKADEAATGEEALDKLSNDKFDLVLLDLRMPGMGGVEALKHIRDLHGNIPVYIMTGFYADYLEKLRDIASEGMNFELMDKPIGRNQLVSLVKNVLPEPLAC